MSTRTTPTGIPVEFCEGCGFEHPVTRPHCTRCGKAHFFREELCAVVEGGHGYICKRCGGPAPFGVGYAAAGAVALEASRGLETCACGYSVRASV